MTARSTRPRPVRQALELLLVHEFALALLDIHMPTMDGFELAELMRGTERSKHMPIIFITASTRTSRCPCSAATNPARSTCCSSPSTRRSCARRPTVFLRAAPAAEALAAGGAGARGRARHRLARHAHAAVRGAHHDVDAAQSEIQADARAGARAARAHPPQRRSHEPHDRRSHGHGAPALGQAFHQPQAHGRQRRAARGGDRARGAGARQGPHAFLRRGHGRDACRRGSRPAHAAVPEPARQCGEVLQGRATAST